MLTTSLGSATVQDLQLSDCEYRFYSNSALHELGTPPEVHTRPSQGIVHRSVTVRAGRITTKTYGGAPRTSLGPHFATGTNACWVASLLISPVMPLMMSGALVLIGTSSSVGLGCLSVS